MFYIYLTVMLTHIIHGQFTKDELLGRFIPESHPDFVRISSEFASHNAHYLRREVAEAFYKMARDAQKDGIRLTVVSSTRNYTRQKTIWENKYNKYAGTPFDRANQILQYSSMPGTSRHHWGTDFDLNSVDPEYFNTPVGQRVYDWLRKHAWKYGFFQPYTAIDYVRNSGYFEEKWHWSYKPLADLFLWAYRMMVSYDDLSGFTGSETAKSLNVIENYVLTIMPDLR